MTPAPSPPGPRGIRPADTLPWLALGLAGACAPAGASAQGRDVSNLYEFFIGAAVVVGGITYGLILWAAIRYRRRSDELPKQTRDHVPLEIVYTAIPVAVVMTLFVFTLLVERDVDRVSPDPAMEVNVTGFQWQWRFDYPQHGVSVVGGPDEDPTLVLPAGQTVRVNLVARDVIHSFYIPEFLFKRDTIPGRTNRFDLLIPRPGRYRGACAEFCGVDHAAMNFWVEAVTAERFEAWLGERAAG